MRFSILILFFCLVSSLDSIYSQKIDVDNKSIPDELKTIPKVEIFESLTKITGIPFNPLLVGGILGAYEYYSTSQELRSGLPFYCSPWFWPFAVVLGLIFVLGGFLPFLKKFLKANEITINKVSPIIVGLPLVVTEAMSLLKVLGVDSSLQVLPSSRFVAFILPTFLPLLSNMLLIFICGVIFFFVWLLMEAINTLILLSPSFIVDWILNIAKYLLLLIIFLTLAISPTISVLLCIVLIILSIKVSGWCFRFTVFGTVYSWDFLTRANRKKKKSNDSIMAFTSHKVENIPIRTLGFLDHTDPEAITYSYRRLLLFNKKVIYRSVSNIVIERGVLYPTLFDKNNQKTIFDLPPRYQTHEENIATKLSIKEIRDGKTIRTIKYAIQWLRDSFSFKSEIA